MVKLNAGSLYQHGECRGRLKECRCRLKKRCWTGTPVRQPSGTTFIALGRAQTLLQGLGGYTRRCADAPPRRNFTHIFEDCNPLHTPTPSIILLVKKKGVLYCSMQIKITKGYRRKAVERYKHIATCVAIFPVLGRSEERRKAPSPWLARQPGC